MAGAEQTHRDPLFHQRTLREVQLEIPAQESLGQKERRGFVYRHAEADTADIKRGIVSRINQHAPGEAQ